MMDERRWMVGCAVMGAALAWSVAGWAQEEAVGVEAPAVEHEEAQRAGEEVGHEVVAGVEMEPEPRASQLTLVLTGNTEGDLARVDCREPAEMREYYRARQVGYVRTLGELSQGGRLPAPVVISAGDAMYPAPLSRYLMRSGEEGARNLVDLLNAVPVDAQSLGNRELSAPRGELIEVMRAARERGLDLQAANLRCENFGGAEAICESTGGLVGPHYKVVERDGVRVAITSLLAPHLLEALTDAQRQGLALAEPAAVLPELLRAMRETADLTVVQYHAREADALDGAYALASTIEGIDLMVASHLFDERDLEEGRFGVVQAETTGTPVVSADSGAFHVHTVELGLNYGTGAPRIREVRPRRVDVTEMPEDRITREVLEVVADAYCEDWGQPLAADAGLEMPFEAGDLQTFMMNVMRFSAVAEVALINAGAFRDRGQFPLTGELTLADVYSALPFDNDVVVAQMEGRALKRIAAHLGGKLRAAGLVLDGEEVRVNGRPVRDDRLYPVVLNDYLAAGGDGVIETDELKDARIFAPAWAAGSPSIAELVVRYVDARSGVNTSAGDEVGVGLSPRGSFPDLHRRFLWTYTGSINASYNQVSVVNPLVGGAGGYEQSQLTVASTDQVNLEGRLAARADSRDHGWDNDLLVQYATTRLADTEDATFEETRDLLRLRSQYRNLALRSHLGGRWYVPGPLVEVQAESEFNRPESRAWHRLDVRGILGFSFKLAEALDLKVGVNIRRDVMAPDGEASWGLNTGYTLRRIDLLDVLGRPVQVESELEYFYNGIARENVHELRSANRLFFAVFDQFFFTASFNAYLYQSGAVGEPGTNTELTLGLNYQWGATRQSF
ncbi:bifunctional metallophosphatase/5'-nucleotidase [Bradymonadaceae bacterium TMQ3]|nr:bifunctional metallophosphatase/5'-nucleotidase [Bradymonadaceae bacterium TMQ3]TXC67698.1 bifunctional metallophosphatase/5'-nucleotidase [Bradymonadales bacterium TMQ1]